MLCNASVNRKAIYEKIKKNLFRFLRWLDLKIKGAKLKKRETNKKFSALGLFLMNRLFARNCLLSRFPTFGIYLQLEQKIAKNYKIF